MKKCELLVPAGGQKQFIAAVENGADAVYVGGKLFNARINAGNFDHIELREAVDFAHKRGVRVYVTMNTLIDDEEMKEAMEYALYLYQIGVDALIVQDAGFGAVVRENLPDFPLHLSTQGSVYDLRGVEMAGRLGYERVVLARELSFEEIREICQNTAVQIEVFVHGALCICYSGQCQMSRSFGGRSGNRGECAQPCRLPYKSFDADSRLIKTYQHPLSPKDHIGQLALAGVASLKIEGRMKSAEYVAIVTSIYRKYLDQYYEQGRYTVSSEDREALEQIFNRGGFTEGYFYENLGRDLMAGDIPKHRGVKIGKVVKKVQGTSLIDVKLYHKLSIGDGVEIQGKHITGNVVTYYKELKGGLTRIGDIKGHVEHGDPLYRITSKEQLVSAGRTFEGKTYTEGKFIRKTPVDMVFSWDEEGMASLTLRCPLREEAVTVTGGPFEKGEGTGIDAGRLEKALRKTGNTPFAAASIKIEEPFDRKIQISSINDLRRRGLELLEEALAWRREEAAIPSYLFYGEDNTAQRLELFFYDVEGCQRFVMPAALAELDVDKAWLIPLVDFERHYEDLDLEQAFIPYITNISKGKEDRFIKEHFDTICHHCRERGVYVGNLSWIQPFLDAGVPVHGDYGLNVYNRFTENIYRALGVTSCIKSLEGMSLETGAFPLMVTEHEPEGTSLVDRKKARVDILRRDFSDQTLLIPASSEVDFDAVKQALSDGCPIVRIYLK